MKLLYEGPLANHPQSVIINDAKILSERTGSSPPSIFGDANQCVDHLTRMGAEQNEDLIVSMDSPLSLREFMIRGSLNIRLIFVIVLPWVVSLTILRWHLYCRTLFPVKCNLCNSKVPNKFNYTTNQTKPNQTFCLSAK